jgi:NACalpha-BTF3-like transcription factor
MIQKSKRTLTCRDQKITIKETDIKVIENDLEITYDEAKALLIQNNGDVNKVIQAFLKDFKFNGIY